MTEPNPDLDARLARLAARKAAAAATPPDSVAHAGPTPPTASRRRRRKHPAAAGRILCVGLSSSAFISMVAAFAQTGTPGTATAAIVTTPVTARVRTKIVVKDVHHAVYVDQFGRPVAAPSVPTGATLAPAGKQPAAGAAPGPSTAPMHSGATTPWGSGSGGSSNTLPAPTTPATSGPTPPPSGGGPTPTTAPAAPPPTVPPTTPTTAHVTPPTTIPAPPPPPPCTGSKCP